MPAIRSLLRSLASWRAPSTLSWPNLPEALRREWGAHEILTLTIDRPERKNALDPELLTARSEEHTSELQSRFDLVCRLLLEKKNLLIKSRATRVDRPTFAQS